MTTLFPIPKTTDTLFEELFAIYPPKRKGTRRMALPAWRSATKREAPEVILAGAKAYAESDPGEYSKGLPAWLNGDCWAIDYSPIERKPDKAMMKARFFALQKRYKSGFCHDFMTPVEILEMNELEKSLNSA